MSDEADMGNDTAELFLAAALRKQQRHATITPSGMGFCLNCEVDIHPIPADPEGKRRWCSTACRDDWQSTRVKNA